jgi:ketosteroid isomerase-like protein
MIRSLFIIAVLLATITNSSAQAVATAAQSERLRQFRADFCAMLTSKKTEGIVSYLSENVRLMPEIQKTIIGKVHAMSYWSAFIKRFEVNACVRTETETLDLGGQLFETGTWSLKLKLKATGKAYELNGKYVDLWDATNDKLLLVTSAWNYNHATEIGNDLRFEGLTTVNVAFNQHLPVNDAVSFELAALNRLMETTITQHDATIWKQFYSDDASFFYSANAPLRGRKALDAFMDEHVKQLPVFEKLDIRNDRIETFGNFVIEYASHIAIVRNGEWSGVFTGKDLAIWRREKSGALKIFRHIAMYD